MVCDGDGHIDWPAGGRKSNNVPKSNTLSQGGAPLDPEALSEVLGSLEDMKVGVISCSPRLAGSIMSDAALVIRALAERAEIKIG